MPAPNLDFSLLQSKLDGFQLAVDHNYRHYQFYGNMIVASVFFAVCDQLSGGPWRATLLLLALILEMLLFFASRDCLRRYYRRTEQVLRPANKSRLIALDEK